MKLIEPAFGLDSFNQTNTYTGLTALAKQILNLITMEPGTIPSCPKMGLGISLYKMEFNSINTHQEIKDNLMFQLDNYLPEYRALVKEILVEKIPTEQLNGSNNGVYIGIITSQIDIDTGKEKLIVFPNMTNSTSGKVVTSFSVI